MNTAHQLASGCCSEAQPSLRRSVRKRKAKALYPGESSDLPRPPRALPTPADASSSDTESGGKSKKPRLMDYEGSINTLDDLVELSKNKGEFANINMKALRRIRPYLEELQAMIGLRSLKETVTQQVLYYMQDLHKDSEDYLHTCIYGGPGTGKTTVAEILGLIFSNLGVLSSKGKFITAQRSDMVGQYLGQTAIKTSLVLETSLGGVLFIDEIYSFGSKEGRDSFAKEAIDTINQFLSENKDDFMLIVGGYEAEVEECFFRQNAGLRRRFMWYHKIEPYTDLDLADMFFLKVREMKWSTADEVTRDWIAALIKDNKDRFKDMGGSVENFLTLLKVQHSKRIFGKPQEARKVINRTDVENTVKKLKETATLTKEAAPPPPGMYM